MLSLESRSQNNSNSEAILTGCTHAKWERRQNKKTEWNLKLRAVHSFGRRTHRPSCSLLFDSRCFCLACKIDWVGDDVIRHHICLERFDELSAFPSNLLRMQPIHWTRHQNKLKCGVSCWNFAAYQKSEVYSRRQVWGRCVIKRGGGGTYCAHKILS